ncbi:MAG: hypothetical protein RLZZ454_1887 [Pseudomonadota bacterium]
METGPPMLSLWRGVLNHAKGLPPPPHSWASQADSDLAIFTVRMEPGARWTLPAATNQETRRQLYFFKGVTLSAAGETIGVRSVIEVRATDAVEIINGEETSELLMLQGRPIGEPVAQYGPFVMNTQEEIHQAFADYRRTEFGGWPWGQSDPVHPRRTEFGGWPWGQSDPVHPREKNRFAKHASGVLETP